ncbi:hypothetical protein JJB07_17255 [Tumebacillus sp. ITR2]|uniref:Uncharacterized protein n=1 Tax=Tumebacillus amylolyticus TaxID=2801339 RepID=A0ABS1JDR2_9BACL|nr:hypothetical protein [Tumebacillus amylolyticus]MBL0388355.1 hypothetical protein [Tumebacillus amylolyticus]
MSGLWAIIVLIGAVVSILRRVKQETARRQQHRQEAPQQEQEQVQVKHEQHQSQPQSPREQTAYEWIFGTSKPDPENHDNEDWMEPVQPSVHMDLEDLQESQREIVHESVHESLHVRHSRLDESPAPQKAKHPLHLDRQTLSQALLLKEALDPPRSLRPWKPGKHR